MNTSKPLKTIRRTTIVFIILLALSGLTAFPLESELNYLVNLLGDSASSNWFNRWIYSVSQAVNSVNENYPFFSYGTDWLAFAHLVIAFFFLGVYRDPVRNTWIIYTGIVACIMIIPIALIAGYIRGIPFFWQLIDCSFGILGLIPLIIIFKNTKTLYAKTNIQYRLFL